ncbi:MAG: flagellar export protein FliJ [Desulfobacteraceae bacterium]|jgi:flagellar FliJ protein
MRYQFKLEALRQYRQFQEDKLQKELAEALRFRDHLARMLDDQLAMRDRTESDLERLQAESTTGPNMTVYESYLKCIGKQIEQQRVKVEQADKLCLERRTVLLAAVQRRKALDKLKEKDYETYLADLNQKEQKFINEMAINRFALKQG